MNLFTVNEPQQSTIATSEHSGTGKEGLSRRNEDQLYLALSSANMGTWDWHLLDHTMHLDERMHALFGLMPSTFSGHYEQFLEMIQAENRQQVDREFAQALERRAEYDGEFRVVWPNGSVHTLRARSRERWFFLKPLDRGIGRESAKCDVSKIFWAFYSYQHQGPTAAPMRNE